MVIRVKYISPDGRVVEVVDVYPGRSVEERLLITGGSVAEDADQRAR
jgi:hypothetical protein